MHAERPNRQKSGAGSVTWRVNSERLVLLGWGRAILMQFAHPLVAQAVMDHSSFRANRLARLRRLHFTVRAMLAMTFGDEAQLRGAAAHINGIHDRIHGALDAPAGPFHAGAAYSAHDPRLLAWVMATLLESVPLAYERFVGPLSGDDYARYCGEARTTGALLGLPASMIPRDKESVHASVRDWLASGEIIVTDHARRLAQDILYPPFQAAYWPAARLMRLATIGLLDPKLRAEYGLTWTPRDERALARWSRGVRTARRLTPRWLATWRVSRI
jgi:uncharacterized protein (DUF2236 family)